LKPFGENGAFVSAVLTADAGLRQVAVRSAGITLLSGGLGLAVQIIATVVLARLLTPVDFGLVAMVTTFSVLLASVGQNGFPEAVVQREEMNHSLASNLFWINLGGGVLLTIVFAATGSLMARFYHDVRVAHVAIGTSFTILLTSASGLHLALLKRAMRFSAASGNDIVARVVSVAVSVFLAWAGWGYWSLVAGAIALPLSQAVGAGVLCRWVPSLPRRHVTGTGSTVLFALNTFGQFGVNYATRNTDNLLIGLRFNAQSLGFYKRAYDLFALNATQFVHSLTLVFVSALNHRVKRDSDEYRQYLLSVLTVMAFFGMGLAGVLTLVGKDLIRVLLGPGWEESGRIFTFFGPGIGAMIVYYTHGWIHLSIGRADRWFRWGIIEFAVTVLLFLVGLPWGPVGIASAWTGSFWLLMVPALWYAGKPIGFGVGPLLAAVWRYILASLLSGFLTFLIVRQIPPLFGASGAIGAAARIVAGTLVLGALYLSAVVVLHRSFEPLYQMYRLLHEMAPWRRITDWSFAVSEARNAEVEHLGAHFAVKSSGKPLVSILIPAYNAEKWIAATIRSAMEQSWEPKEIIIVDDGSTDRTLEIARQFESKSVRIVKQENQGASAARNKAFSMSHGDYIQWLDADDLLAPDKISKQMEVAIQGAGDLTVLSCPWGQFWHRHYRGRFIPTALWCDLSASEFLIRKMGQNIFMQTSTWLVSRKLTAAAGPWATTLSVDDDGEYFCRVLLGSDGIRFVPDAKVYYRYSGTSGLNYIGQSNKKLDSFWRSMQFHIDYLRSLEDSERARESCIKYLQTNLIYFYATRKDIVEQAQQKAKELGRRLDQPRLDWKFAWLKTLFGWSVATRAQLFVPHIMCSIITFWDKILFRIEIPEEQGGREAEIQASSAKRQLQGAPEEIGY
jgi:O-antigen/teichoic acid export membrane protein/glycosyltransferase involved in cell wall biosynthesis